MSYPSACSSTDALPETTVAPLRVLPIVTTEHRHSREHAHDHAGHSHAGHAHHIHRDASTGRLSATLALVLLYMVAELIGGWLANSLTLLADAGHMLSDAAALGLSLFAASIARRPPTAQHSYGYYRAEILAALANGALLAAISLWVIVEAYHRLWDKSAVQGPLMMGIAVGGLVVNCIGLWLLHPGQGASINIRGAWLHVLSDLLGSLAAIAGAALIWAYGWNWADPLASAAISLLIIYSSWGLLKEAIGVLMEGTPSHVDLDQVREAIATVPGIEDVHDLHIWTITSGMEALSGHVVTSDGQPAPQLLAELRKLLHDKFGIDHITIQIEPPNFDDCRTRC
jgi:cobalt-zinc-cadmium efflux system protein